MAQSQAVPSQGLDFVLKDAYLVGNAEMVKYAASMAADTRALNQVMVATFYYL